VLETHLLFARNTTPLRRREDDGYLDGLPAALRFGESDVLRCKKAPTKRLATRQGGSGEESLIFRIRRPRRRVFYDARIGRTGYGRVRDRCGQVVDDAW